jgi:hypothetical protein
MKTKFFFLIALILSLVYAGCEKEKPADPTPAPPVNYPLLCDIQVNKDTVTVGGNVAFQWTSNADSLILTINENSYQTLNKIGTKVFGIQETSGFVFRFYKNDSTSAKTFTIIAVPPPPTPPTLTVVALLDTIEYGASTTITITSNGDSISSDLPGFTGVSGDFPTPNLTESTTYHFTAYGEGGQTSASVNIAVIPLPTDTDYVCSHPWRADSVFKTVDTLFGWTYKFPYETSDYDFYRIFFSDGNYESYRIFDNVNTGGGQWYFENNWIYFNYGFKYILNLNYNEFIVKFEEGCVDCPNGVMYVKIRYTAYYP